MGGLTFRCVEVTTYGRRVWAIRELTTGSYYLWAYEELKYAEKVRFDFITTITSIDYDSGNWVKSIAELRVKERPKRVPSNSQRRERRSSFPQRRSQRSVVGEDMLRPADSD